MANGPPQPWRSNVGAYRREVLRDRPAVYWPLSDLSGVGAVDQSGNGRTGTYSGGYTLGRGGAVPGDPGASAGFNGSNSKVRLASAPVSQPPATLEIWFNQDAANAGDLLVVTSSVNNAMWMRILANASLSAVLADVDNSDGYQGGSGFVGYTPAGSWHHVVATFAASAVQVFVNGQLAGGGTFSGTFSDLDRTSVGVLDRPSVAEWYTGLLAHAAVYNYVLGADRIAAHCAAGRGRLRTRRWIPTSPARGVSRARVLGGV